MIFNHSMSLKEYIDTNWIELPKELVDLFNKESDLYEDQSYRIEEERERAEMYMDEAQSLSREVLAEVYAYTTMQISPSDMVTNIRYHCENHTGDFY